MSFVIRQCAGNNITDILPPMPDAVDANDPDFIGYLVNHPVVAHGDAPVILAAGQLAATAGRGLVAKVSMAVITRT